MIPKITYQEIIDKVKTYAKTNCKNIANYNSIPAQYKAGFAFTVGTRYANFIGEGGNLTIKNPVVSVNASTVDTDMDTFLNNLGLSKLKFFQLSICVLSIVVRFIYVSQSSSYIMSISG